MRTTKLLAVAALAFALAGPAAVGVADAQTVPQSFSCGQISRAIHYHDGGTRLSAGASASCDPNNSGRVCLRVDFLRYGRIIAARTECRTSAGRLSPETGTVAHQGSGYSVDAYAFAG